MDDTHRKQFSLITYAQLLVFVGIFIASVVWANKFWLGSRIPATTQDRSTVEVSLQTDDSAPVDSAAASAVDPSSNTAFAANAGSEDSDDTPSIDQARARHLVNEASDINDEANPSNRTDEVAEVPASVSGPSGLDHARERTARWLSAITNAGRQLGRPIEDASTDVEEESTNDSDSDKEPPKSDSDNPSHDSSTQRRDVVRISNKTDYPVSFMWKDVSRQLKPQQSVDLDLVSAESSVRYDRGGSFGEVTVPIRAGAYEFEVSRKGWRLTEVTSNSDNN